MNNSQGPTVEKMNHFQTTQVLKRMALKRCELHQLSTRLAPPCTNSAPPRRPLDIAPTGKSSNQRIQQIKTLSKRRHLAKTLYLRLTSSLLAAKPQKSIQSPKRKSKARCQKERRTKIRCHRMMRKRKSKNMTQRGAKTTRGGPDKSRKPLLTSSWPRPLCIWISRLKWGIWRLRSGQFPPRVRTKIRKSWFSHLQIILSATHQNWTQIGKFRIFR